MSRLYYLVIFDESSLPGSETHAFIFDLSPGLWDLGDRMREKDMWVGRPEDESLNGMASILMAAVTKTGEDRFELNVLGAEPVYESLKTLTGWTGPVLNLKPEHKMGYHIWHLTPPE